VYVDPSGETIGLPMPWRGGCTGLCSIATHFAGFVIDHPQESLAVTQVGACLSGVGCGLVAVVNLAYTALSAGDAALGGDFGCAATHVLAYGGSKTIAETGVRLIVKQRARMNRVTRNRGKTFYYDMRLDQGQVAVLEDFGRAGEAVLGARDYCRLGTSGN
jgi:hypothetical protein